ncbi:DUF4190 domain-containing protein [Micromonospora thermarum]|uniref:DUF4190 domain-containing protein n=1 Tax=Micromonospora thermarum TaxID=2720024 RepID=A0ABX0ZEG9_9ACTN|nr:DUF4190 domain-containing protein [Micromonospora thermarum]NJP35619.1 DUF4190 domain-containing protein [Micromonospora thermarum]
MSQPPPPDPDRPPSPWEQPAPGAEPPPQRYDPHQPPPPPPGHDPYQPPPSYGPPAGPPYGQQWGAPPGGYGPPPGGGRGMNVLAILSLVFAFVFAPAGIVLGHLAKRQISTSGEEGDQLATWGLILSYIFTALGVLVCCGWIALFAIAGNDGMMY